METKKIFVASSMLNPFRDEIPAIVGDVNKRSRTFHFELVMFENTPFPLRDIDNQQELNRLAAECDIFLFLIGRDDTVGEFTMGEYKSAYEACMKKSMRTPVIMPYIIYTGSKQTRKIPYRELLEGVVVQGDSIEERIYNDFSGRKYSRFVSGDNTPDRSVLGNDFLSTLEQDLLKTINDFYYYRRDELSYAHHISNSTQSIRNSTSRYFVREELDGAMKEIVDKSSLLILEGNSFSGKTRAVYELMKNNPRWQDADFYIYNCGYDTHSVDTINAISTYRGANSPHAVFFIDDFSKILDTGAIEDNAPFWQLMRGITPDVLPVWDKITVVITMSGELTYHEKHNYYRKIFGNDIYQSCYMNTLNELIVNFDIYDRHSFNVMAAEMVRAGIISREAVRPGNYTIGSLFVDMTRIRGELQSLFSLDSNLQKAAQLIKMQLMYCNSLRRGLYEDIKNLWLYATPNQSEQMLVEALERLCSMRWIVLDYENSHIKYIHIDYYVLEAITLPHDFVDFLVGYALSGGDVEVTIPERMAYILSDRLCLSTDEIKRLVERFGGVTGAVSNKNARNFLKICHQYKDNPQKKREHQYANVFCQNAISSLIYSDIVAILDEILALLNDAKTKEIAKTVLSDLYTKTVFRILAEKRGEVSRFQFDYEIKPLTMAQEREMLARIFGADEYKVENMKYPFSPDDLLDIFNLRRITRFLSKSPMEIVDMVKKAALRSAEDYVMLIEDDLLGDAEVTDQEGIDHIFIPQLGALLKEAMLKTTTYSELCDIISILQKSTEQHINEAVSRYSFTLSFYKSVKRLAQRYTYEDRFELFKYLIALPDNHSILNRVDGSIDVSRNRFERIRALNDMLLLLDETSVIQAYEQMVTSDIIDEYTLSMYMNNGFLMFEHLFDAVMKHGRGNYLTNNKLLDKAKTLSDAHMCIHAVMHVRDDDPARLDDEYALGAYLAIRELSCERTIEILKQWRNYHPGKLLKDRTLGTIISKFSKSSAITTRSIALLFGIPEENDYLHTADQLYDEWGLKDKEINILRQNPQCWNQFIQRLNRNNELSMLHPIFLRLINNEIEDLAESSRQGKRIYLSTTHDLVFNENYKTYIISEYIKNYYETYDETRKFIDDLRAGETPFRLTAYIFKSYLRKIVNETVGNNRKKVDETTRLKGIGRVNEVLIEAYQYFVNEYSSSEVIEQMSNLYGYRIQLVGDDAFDLDKIMPYAYEERILQLTFVDYLDFILDNETAYADGNFVFMALRTMNNRIEECIYRKIKAIAKKNHRGIDMEKKSNSDNMRLSAVVHNRLINTDNGTITVDHDIVYNYSPIKMLIYIAETEHISYQTMEEYRTRIKAPVTSTYLNQAFKVISTDGNIDDKYGTMKNLLDTHCNGNTLLSKSMQMFIGMLKVSATSQQLNEVIALFPNEFRNTSEFLSVWCRRYFHINSPNNVKDTLNDIHDCIASHHHLINIAIVNSYLSSLYLVTAQYDKSKVEQSYLQLLTECWDYLNATGNISMNILLQLPVDAPLWEIPANQLSYIYFSHICPINIFECVAHRFNGNFYYESKKSCLSDCLKNYMIHQGARLRDMYSVVVPLLVDEQGKCVYYNELAGIRKEARRGNGWLSNTCRKLCDKLNIH